MIWHGYETRQTRIFPLDTLLGAEAGPGIEGCTVFEPTRFFTRWRPGAPLGWDWAAPIWHLDLPANGLLIAFPRSWDPSRESVPFAPHNPWARSAPAVIRAQSHRPWPRETALAFWRNEPQAFPVGRSKKENENRVELLSTLGDLVGRIRALGDGEFPLISCEVVIPQVDHVSMRALGILAGVHYLEPLPPYRAACSGEAVVPFGRFVRGAPTAAISPARSAGREDSLRRIEYQIRGVQCPACQVAIDRARSWGSDASQGERMRAIVSPHGLPSVAGPSLARLPNPENFKTFENSWTWGGAEIAG